MRGVRGAAQRRAATPVQGRPQRYTVRVGLAACGCRTLSIIATLALFAITAWAELLGCWLVWYGLRGGGSAIWLLPAAACLAVFAWLLTLHPSASGRVYAAYGGIYVLGALGWLRVVDDARLTPTDLAGGALILAGCVVIVSGFRAG